MDNEPLNQNAQAPQPPIPEKPKRKSKKPLLIIGAVITVLLLLIGMFFGLNWYIRMQELGNNQVACTADAKICPDGSAVGRSGSNCEFAPCPTVSPQDIPTITLDPQIISPTSSTETYLGQKICQKDNQCVNGEKCLEVGIGAVKPPVKTCWREEVIPQ